MIRNPRDPERRERIYHNPALVRVRQRATASPAATGTRNLGTDTRPHTRALWSVVPSRHSRPGTVTASRSRVVSVCAPRSTRRCPCLAVALCLLWLSPRAGGRLLILLETIRNNGPQKQNISLVHRRGPEKTRKKLHIMSKCVENV